MSQESPHQHGPLADEAGRLLGAAQDWWQRTGSEKLTGIATGSEECCWCPVCQLIATLRGDRPELTEKLAETQTAVSGLLRALADAVSGPPPAPKAEPVGVSEHRSEERARSAAMDRTVQRIELDRQSD